MRLRWDAPEYDGGYTIVAYELQQAPALAVSNARYGEYVHFSTIGMIDGTHMSAPEQTAANVQTVIELPQARTPWPYSSPLAHGPCPMPHALCTVHRAPCTVPYSMFYGL